MLWCLNYVVGKEADFADSVIELKTTFPEYWERCLGYTLVIIVVKRVLNPRPYRDP